VRFGQEARSEGGDLQEALLSDGTKGQKSGASFSVSQADLDLVAGVAAEEDGLGKLGGDGVDEKGSFADEAEVGGGEFEDALGLELDEGGLVFGEEEFARKTFDGAELEGEAFEAPGFVVEDFDGVLGVADGGDALEVFAGVAHVLMAFALEGRDGGGAEAEVVVAGPISVVVTGACPGEGVVGCFVVFESVAGEEFIGEGEHLGIEIGVVDEISGLEFFEEGGVFFVGEIVGGNMVGLKSEGLSEGILPVEEGLAGDREDEVEIDLE